MASLSEFDLIERYFSPLGLTSSKSVLLGSGDDCGVIQTPAEMSLCFSVDTMVEGVHFPKNAPPFELGYRALAAAVSDLAAVGATPYFFTLALTLPDANQDWLAQFSSGLKVLVDKYHFPLLGGDTTRGPLTVTIQVHGLLSKPALLRSGARAGDVLAVSGTLGDAGAALDFLSIDLNSESLEEDQQFLLSKYYLPTPRIELGQILQDYASACIDISDGLLAEAGHISRASKVKVELNLESLPLSGALLRLKDVDGATQLALNSGDDYELLFSVPIDKWSEFCSNVPEGLVTQIGSIVAGEGVELRGKSMDIANKGYQHFE